MPNFYTGTLFSRRLRIGAMALGYYTPGGTPRCLAGPAGHYGPLRSWLTVRLRVEQLPQAFERLAGGPMGKVVVKVKP